MVLSVYAFLASIAILASLAGPQIRKPKKGVVSVYTELSTRFTTFRTSLDGWEKVTETNMFSWFYNKDKITRQSRSIVKAWVRLVLKESAQARMDFEFGREQRGQTLKGYDTYSYTLELIEYNCLSRQSRSTSYVDYDSSGSVLDSVQMMRPTWRDVIPDSVGERMLEIICRATKRTHK